MSTETKAQPTCADRVEAAEESRRLEIAALLAAYSDDRDWECEHDDDLDHECEERPWLCGCGKVTCKPERCEYCGEDQPHEDQLFEYGLAADYVPAGTFSDQELGFYRYQISYGGPQEEVRFWCDEEGTPWKAEFWYLDWWDGAKVEVTRDPVWLELWRVMFEGVRDEMRRRAVEG